MSKATIKVDLRPFQIPNFVTIDLKTPSKSDTSAASVPISELDHDALDALAEQWLDALYKKANKRNPFIVRASERAA